jgi:RNA polymerase sigma-70 factor (ECF subfamily)
MDAPAEDPGAALMLAFQAGDETAFERLVERYSGRAYALCTRFLGEIAGREDLVQEAFLRVFRARERYRPTALFSTWLYRIVYNLCANQRERRREMLSLEAGADEDGRPDSRGLQGRNDVADEAAPDPASGLEGRDVTDAVRAAIAALPESQRMALILAKYEGLSLAEIAEVLDSSEKAVKSLVHRARENLRARLAPWLVEETR